MFIIYFSPPPFSSVRRRRNKATLVLSVNSPSRLHFISRGYTNIIWIPKPGKVDYKIPKAWRPISLSNYLIKTLEKLITWETARVIKQNPIHEKQHGFRSDRSTETAISANVDYIEQHILMGKSVLGVFLDIQAAFDTIKPELIRSKLIEHGGDSDMVDWYYNYICLLYTSPSPRDKRQSRMPSSA